MKKIILIVLLIVVLAFIVHWTGLPIGTYVDMFLDKVFSWTNNFIPKLTELIPKFGQWVTSTIQSFKS